MQAAGSMQLSPSLNPPFGAYKFILMRVQVEASEPAQKRLGHAYATRAARFALCCVERNCSCLDVDIAPSESCYLRRSHPAPYHDSHGGGTRSVLWQERGAQEPQNLLQRERFLLSLS